MVAGCRYALAKESVPLVERDAELKIASRLPFPSNVNRHSDMSSAYTAITEFTFEDNNGE